MSTNTTYGFTETELDIAKHTDLLSLLPSLGYTLKRIGSYYTTAEMDSIRIRDPTRWKRYSTGQGGNDCLPGIRRRDRHPERSATKATPQTAGPDPAVSLLK